MLSLRRSQVNQSINAARLLHKGPDHDSEHRYGRPDRCEGHIDEHAKSTSINEEYETHMNCNPNCASTDELNTDIAHLDELRKFLDAAKGAAFDPLVGYVLDASASCEQRRAWRDLRDKMLLS